MILIGSPISSLVLSLPSRTGVPSEAFVVSGAFVVPAFAASAKRSCGRTVSPPHEEQGQQTINDGSPKSGYHDRQRARQPCAAEPVQPLPQVGQRSDHSRRNPHCQRDGGQFVHAGVTPVTGIQPEGIEHRYLDQQYQQGKNQQRLGI